MNKYLARVFQYVDYEQIVGPLFFRFKFYQIPFQESTNSVFFSFRQFNGENLNIKRISKFLKLYYVSRK